MTFQEAADLAGELKPRIVIPGHWDMFRDNPGDPEAFKDYIEAKYGISPICLIPRVGEPIRLKTDKILPLRGEPERRVRGGSAQRLQRRTGL